ncbi:single-stranded DNA-binding protein [Myxococcota bacterium]|nr:single-stranded DNA-binding protein [Myxococcota bacterium]
MNKCMIVGVIREEPDLKTTQSGRTVLSLRVEVDESYTRNGERQKRSSWHTAVFWGDKARDAAAAVSLGSLVFVSGRMSHRKYETNSGETKRVTEINADEVLPLGAQAAAAISQSSGEKLPGIHTASAAIEFVQKNVASEFSDEIPF